MSVTRRKSGIIPIEANVEGKGWNERIEYLEKAEKWCEKRWRRMLRNPNGTWNRDGRIFWFKEEEDALLFKLTWG